jgi:hypothetical protein
MLGTIKEYESFLGSLQLFPELFKNKTVEMDLKGELNPSFMLDDLFFKQKKWLSFTAFFDYYFNQHKDEIKNRFGFSNYESFADGLRARLYRTQFGFLTEYHAFFLSAALFGEKNVSRNTELDLAGVDFQVHLHGNLYNIHIFIDSQRAWDYRNYKSTHKQVNNWPGIHVNLPYSLKAGCFNSLRFLKNRFGVYTESYLRYFENEVKTGKIKNNNITGTTAKGFIYSS